MTPTVILIGADKGGVGKTTVTRALLDYLNTNKINTRAFDTQWPNGDLKHFNPATLIDISSIEGQMEVFDGVTDKAITVVDICAGQLTPTIQALDDAQLLDEVRTGHMKLVLLHVLGPTLASISEVATAAKTIGNAKHLLVKNHINKTKFSLSGIPGADDIFAKYAGVTVHVPQLPEVVCETMQATGGSFMDYMSSGQSKTLRGHVNTWLTKVWAEFDRVGTFT